MASLGLPRPPVVGVILAAGEGRRAGGPKATQTLALTSLLGWCAQCLWDGGIRSMVVVGPKGTPELATRLQTELAPAVRSSILLVTNPRPQGGPTSSLRAALKALRASGSPPTAVLMHPVDFPLVRAETVAALLKSHARALAKGKTPAVIVPLHGGRRGHPVLLAGAALEEAAALPRGLTVKDIVRKDSRRVITVRTGDHGILMNLNTREELASAELWLRSGRRNPPPGALSEEQAPP